MSPAPDPTERPLRVVAGPAAGEHLAVEDELVLGRAVDGPGRLGGDPEISRRHARVTRAAGQLFLEDLGSTNGTRVNARRIDALTALAGGDRVELGGTAIEVLAPAVATPARPAAPAAPAGEPSPALAPPAPPLAAAPGPPPPRSEPARASAKAAARAHRRRLIITGVAALILIAAAVALALRSGSGHHQPMTARGPATSGTVYVETNVAAPRANSILALSYHDGSFRPLHITEYPTGGSGSADLTNSGVLDADQQVTVNAARTLLFAVNQGSDTIAAFRIAADGSLTPVAGSPFPSGGRAPASLAVSGNILVVANKAHDGVRNLTTVAPNYTTFTVSPQGSLRPTGSVISLPPRSSPTQVYVPPAGGLVFTTEESGLLRVLGLSAAGRLSTAPGSPQGLPNSLFTNNGPRPVPVWPAGLSTNPDAPILYSGIPNYGSIVAYDYDTGGQLTLQSEAFDPNAFLPCWSVVSPDGHWLYFANAGTDNVSVWDLRADPRHPRLEQTLTLRGGGNPWGLRLDPAGHFLYVITPRQVSQIPPGEGQLLHSLRIAANGTLTEIATSPVPLPVALNTNPFGLAVVPDRVGAS